MKYVRPRSLREKCGPRVHARTGSAVRLAPPDYAILLTSLNSLLPTGAVAHLLDLAALEGVEAPNDLA